MTGVAADLNIALSKSDVWTLDSGQTDGLGLVIDTMKSFSFLCVFFMVITIFHDVIL